MDGGRLAWTAMAMALALSACGRWGFDPAAGDGGADVDAPPEADAPTGVDGSVTADALAPANCDAGCVSLTIPLAADEDDGAINSGQHLPGGVTSGHIEMGRVGGDTAWGYFRFALPVAVPATATVIEARMNVHTDVAQNWNEAGYQLLILAEDSADAAVVTSAEERPDGTVPGFVRFPLATSVRWNGTGLPWPADTWVTTPDLAPLIQGLIDGHGGLAAGSHVQLWMRGEGFTADGVVVAADFRHPALEPTSLSIAFTAPP